MLLTYKDINNKYLGGKAKALAELEDFGFNIPKWFVVPSTIFINWLKENENNINTPEKFIFSENIKNEIFSKINTENKYAVRSSANAEDSKNNSFAGQFETYLNIKKENILEHILKVFTSGLSERVKEYSKNKNINIYDLIPSVIIQEQIDADKAGVAFGVNPITGNTKEILISAVYGLGSALVDGSINADTIIVNKNTNKIDKNIAKKDFKEICTENGITKEKLEYSIAISSVLKDKEIIEIKNMVKKLSDEKLCPQDMEWAIKNNILYLLQSRPITNLNKIENKIDQITTWDNSNIVESYGGVTTPLTYSFIRHAYCEVYKQMCKMFNVPQEILDYNNYTFEHMLGLINGRVYYNMISWYQLLTMLPGYNFNKDFMIQMMGAKEGIPEEALKIVENSKYPSTKTEDLLNLLKGLSGLCNNHFKIKKLTENYYKNVKHAMGTEHLDGRLENMSLYELGQYYRRLERELIKKWDAPVINDFFAMIYYGIFRKISENWNDGKLKQTYNDLLCGDGNIISAVPAKQIKLMANELINSSKTEPELINIFCNAPLKEIEKNIVKHTKLNKLVQNYLLDFGDRCLEELKLETKTLTSDPINLYRSIGNMANRILNNTVKEIDEDKLRKNAEKIYKEVLKDEPLKLFVYNYITEKTRYFVRNRENLRFERTRVFGLVRKIMFNIGVRLYSCNIIEKPRDIFYLEIDEILGFIEGNATTTNLKDLIKIRKKQFNLYKTKQLPQRFNTYGAVNINNSFKSISTKTNNNNYSNVLQGTPCCAGIVKGYARKVTNPKNANLKSGEILITERTDPGWIMLFPIASAILVEKGSLLSHAAIVTREMGIPSIVGIDNLMDTIKTGDYLEVDCSTGIIKIIKEEK